MAACSKWCALSISVMGCMRVMTCQYSAAAAASSPASSTAVQWPKAGGVGMPVPAGSVDKGCSRRESMSRMRAGGLSGPGHSEAAQCVEVSRRSWWG
ncbi:Uncharacterised protein [Bordetella pertussis]|nr:Uncharacterised protein [Bordetella pertussis]